MLERAAGCLENAGRRFFRNTNGAARKRGPSCSHFRHYNGVDSESPNWAFSYSLTSDQRWSYSLSTASGVGRVANDMRTPFLDFLYPVEAKRLAASCLLRQSKRVVPRRRKRSIPCFNRPYTSDATSPYENYGTNGLDQALSSSDKYLEDNEVGGESAKQDLVSLLEEGVSDDYNRAWSLFAAAGRPPDMNSVLLAYLSNSSEPVDEERATSIFDGIPEKRRVVDDYFHLAKSRLSVRGDFSAAKEVYREAVGKNAGLRCWALLLSYAIDRMQWTFAIDMWILRPASIDYRLLSYTDSSSVSLKAIDLATFLHDQPDNAVGLEFAHFLLRYIVGSLKAIDHTPTETILSLLRTYNKIGVLNAGVYYKFLDTLMSSKTRSSFVRSIVVYRNLRWRMNTERPPRSILTGLLASLASFEISSGVQYLLDEYSHFYTKPSVEAYRQALIAFSRTGEVTSVNRVFGRFLVHYEKPSNRIMAPLLYVYARLGDTRETLRQFERVKEEFGLEQDTSCWNILLMSHARAGDAKGAFEVFERMMKKGIQPDSHTFGTMMGVSANRGDIDTVRYLLDVANRRRVSITTPMLDTVVEGYSNSRRLDMAENMAEACLQLDVSGSRVRMWNVLLWNYAFRLDLEAISRIRSRMETARLHPDGMTYAALMLALVLIGEPDAARRILRTFHRSRRVHATEFHYTIVLYGYVKARNRDMVHIIFEEIKERFGRPGLSPRLLVLRTQLRRDMENVDHHRKDKPNAVVRFRNAEKLLLESIADFDVTSLASKQPSPGIGKQSLSQAFPAVYYEHIIRAYGTIGAVDRARELFDEYISGRESLDSSTNPNDLPPLRLATALMLAHLKEERYDKVERRWKMIFPNVVKISRRPNIDQWLSLPSETSDNAKDKQPVHPRPSSTDSRQGNSKAPVSLASADSSDSTGAATIIPSYRFMLSEPLSLYMRSLMYRDEPWKIRVVIKEVEDAGFVLTTYNWSTCVQMLAQSERPSDQFEAFVIFEQKFIQNFTGWDSMRRGLGARPEGVPDTVDLLEHPKRPRKQNLLGKAGRRHWSKIQPDFMQPTYITMIYLASALLSFRERSVIDGGKEVRFLYDACPETVKALSGMPYLREKYQGVIIRRRQLKGDDKAKVKPYEPFVWTGGILGVDGEPRWRRRDAESAEEEFVEEDEEQETRNREQLSGVSVEAQASDGQRGAKDAGANADAVTFERTLDRQDEYDIEAETLLEERRRSTATDDTELDDEELLREEEERQDEKEKQAEEEMQAERERLDKEESGEKLEMEETEEPEEEKEQQEGEAEGARDDDEEAETEESSGLQSPRSSPGGADDGVEHKEARQDTGGTDVNVGSS